MDTSDPHHVHRGSHAHHDFQNSAVVRKQPVDWGTAYCQECLAESTLLLVVVAAALAALEDSCCRTWAASVACTPLQGRFVLHSLRLWYPRGSYTQGIAAAKWSWGEAQPLLAEDNYTGEKHDFDFVRLDWLVRTFDSYFERGPLASF